MKRGKIKRICHFDGILLGRIRQLMLCTFMECEEIKCVELFLRKSPHAESPESSATDVRFLCHLNIQCLQKRESRQNTNWLFLLIRHRWIFKFLLMKWFIYAADDVYHSLFAETFNFPFCFSFIWLCTAWGHKLSVRGRIEIICHFPLRGRMRNLAVLLTTVISLRQGVLEVKYLGTGDAKQCLWVCY